MGGGIFPSLELKQKGPADLKDQALIGVDVIDTEDWYEEAKNIQPEADEDLEVRYDLIANYYKNMPVPAGKSICVIVATHAAQTTNLVYRFNTSRHEDILGFTYCVSFETLIKINPDGTR